MTKSKPKKQISPRVFPLIAASLLLAAPLQAVWAQDDSEEDDGRRVRRLGDTVSEQQEYSLDFPTDLAAQQPAVETPDVTLPDAAQNEQLHNLLEDLAYNPGNQQIEADLNTLLDDVEQQARSALGDGNLVLANQLLQVVGTLQPERPSVAQIGNQINRRRNINQLLTSGQTALQQSQFVSPEDESAAHFFGEVLTIDTENAAALAGLQQVHQALLEQALSTAGDLDFGMVIMLVCD